MIIWVLVFSFIIMIGVFDSGAGGLMVLHYLTKLLPKYDYVYLGDQLHVPYGPRSPEIVRQLTERNVNILFERGAKIVLIACNTATTAALRHLQQTMPDKKILGVVIPSAEKAVEATRFGRVGVVGTRGAIKSNIYEAEIAKLAVKLPYVPKCKRSLPTISVYHQACPLLVPLIEEGWGDKPETRMILRKYLQYIKSCNIDTLILGCTHYAVLEKEFGRIMGKNCVIVNSAKVQAESFVEYLSRHKEIETQLSKRGRRLCYTTDCSEKFMELSSIFLEGTQIDRVETVDLSFS